MDKDKILQELTELINRNSLDLAIDAPDWEVAEMLLERLRDLVEENGGEL